MPRPYQGKIDLISERGLFGAIKKCAYWLSSDEERRWHHIMLHLRMMGRFRSRRARRKHSMPERASLLSIAAACVICAGVFVVCSCSKNKPDIIVPLTLSDLRQGRDAVLEEARRLLRSQGQSSN